MFQNPNVPNGLNRWLDWRVVTLDYDRILLNYRQEWAERFERDSDHTGEWHLLLILAISGFSDTP